ncbi:MAG: SusD/RagB family nutrient-binding outer membrane lipoprotein [Bacteroidales bacterium]|nr:SusD/RagB family nutrient-binding outer membrane lipoprotein [Candidatus Cryptobacteroides caccocaballi]
MKKYILTIFAAAAALSATSCGNWLDVNDDPNAVTSVENGLVIPSIELNLVNVSGFYGHMLGSFYSDQMAIKPGGPQYLGLAHWDASSISSGQAVGYTRMIYRDSYTKVIGNATTLRAKAESEKNWGDYLVATVLRAYGFQILVDAFGETPYSEALDPSNLAPKYDEGKDVYAGILAELDDALSKVSLTDKASDNMLFSSSSDINNWIQFANALKLRILMRESAVVDVKSAVEALVKENNFPSSDIGFDSSVWTNQAGLDNPIYGEAVRVRGDVGTGRTIEFCAHMAVTGTMMEVNDGRLPAKYNVSAKYGNYEGGFIDEQMSKEIDAGYLGKKSEKTQENTWAELKINYDTPMWLITVAETEFFLAEYYAKLANDSNKAKEHYEAAIDASFATHGVSGSEKIYGEESRYAWDASKASELIGIQKWVALAGINGFESWCELRRTGYPQFGPKTGAEIYSKWVELAKANVADGKDNPTPLAMDLEAEGVYVPGTIFTPVNVVSLSANTLLGRLMYATYSTDTNSNAPSQKDPSTKVFWAK